jgi:hypothetical protein
MCCRIFAEIARRAVQDPFILDQTINPKGSEYAKVSVGRISASHHGDRYIPRAVIR